MTENAMRDRETASTAAAWLMRGRVESIPVLVQNTLPQTTVPSIAIHEAAQMDEAPKPETRNWSSTLDLIHEATTAIRISEERSAELEVELQRTVTQAMERERFLEQKVSAAEARADLAETRAREAEVWLSRLHDAVVAGFTRPAPEPAQSDVPHSSVA